MAEKPNHTFLKVGPRWVNMSMVTDVFFEEEKATVSFAAPMARKVSSPPGIVTDTRRLILKDPDEVATIRKWCSRNDVG